MADALPTLLSFPPDKKKPLSAKEYDKEISNYLKAVDKLPNSAWTKSSDKKSLLELLDPAVNSLAYLFALNESLAAAGKDAKRLDELTTQAQLFITCFDPVQVRYAGEQWRAVFEWLLQAYENSNTADFSPLVNALLRLDPTAGTFTSSHLRLLRMCLSHSVPSQALPILDQNIYAFPQKPVKNVSEELLCEEHELSNAYITSQSGFSSKMFPEYVLEYYLLGAHIYIGMRNWNRARQFLEYVILSPTQQHASSALQAEAYKKWVLVGLLAEGKTFPLPRTADHAVMKSIRAVAKPYDMLADDFYKRDPKKLQADIDVANSVWQEDGNLRLVKEATEAMFRYRVIDLQKTYAALPLSRISKLLDAHPSAILQLITEMIQFGYLDASISTDDDPVLRFHATSADTTSGNTDLEAQTRRINDLVTFVRDADRRLQLTREYVEVQKRMKRSGGLEGDLADAMDLTWDGGPMAAAIDEDGDEDIMAS